MMPGPCQHCIRAGVSCEARSARKQQMDVHGTKHGLSTPDETEEHDNRVHLFESTTIDLSRLILSGTGDWQSDTSALPGGQTLHHEANLDTSQPQSTSIAWSTFVGTPLPSREALDAFLDSFFVTVDWYMMVIEESSFRTRYDNLISSGMVMSGQENFARLVMVTLALGAHYLAPRSTTIGTGNSKYISTMLISKVRSSFLELIEISGIEAVQICVLLGSFHLFNGKPNSGFGIMGCAVKLAQTLGLHRRQLFPQSSQYALQNRQYTWWALEIFDKYAATVFGRPCIIDDSDCDVHEIADTAQPGSDPYQFRLSGEEVSLLSYHRYKCSLYRIMGPFLGRRIQSNRLETVAVVHQRLTQWNDSLPAYLRILNVNRELDTSSTSKLQTLRLQALALQLAYDNLQIVLHRWVIRKKADGNKVASQLSWSQLSRSAMQTSRVGSSEHAGVLADCQNTHAAMHLGLCLFTSGVVLCASVLQDPLSPHAYEAKRSIRKIIEMHRLDRMGAHSVTSQSIGILERLVDHIMSSERDLLLGTVPDVVTAAWHTQPEETARANIPCALHETYTDTLAASGPVPGVAQVSDHKRPATEAANTMQDDSTFFPGGASQLTEQQWASFEAELSTLSESNALAVGQTWLWSPTFQ